VNRESGIGSRESGVGNRESGIGSRGWMFVGIFPKMNVVFHY
jgi:hypothetical protein